MSKLPISVHILTWNSEKTLEEALRSIALCSEILVIDGGSTDGTLAIAEKFGARVFPQRMPGMQGEPLSDFSVARNVGLAHATQPWILCLDSDETLTNTAIQHIHQIVDNPAAAAAWLVPRRYVLSDGRVVQWASTYPNERMYFFRKDAAETWEKPVHERIRLKPGTRIGRMRGGTLAPLPPIGAFYSKLAQYVRIEAEADRGKGWWHWLTHRVLHTLRGRLFALLKLLWIWLIPRRGTKLPLRYEMARFWYGWRLILETSPPYRPQ